jgi:hypothetical protein
MKGEHTFPWSFHPFQPRTSDPLHPCAFTMIYFTTFILTLLLSHIARATPACVDVTSPEELYDPTYADAQSVPPIVVVYSVTWSSKYDNPNANVSCSNGPHGLVPLYPHFRNLPGFPYIGGAFNIKRGSPNCGECWKLTHLGTHKSILFTAIDTATTGFNISREAFIVLNGGKLGSGRLEAEAKLIPRHFCGFK